MSTFSIFILVFSPLRIVTFDMGTENCFAIKLHRVLLALPSVGRAATLIFNLEFV